jgi:hypothetical protein
MSRFAAKIGYYKYVDSDRWNSAPFMWDNSRNCFVELDGSVSKRFFESLPEGAIIDDDRKITDVTPPLKRALALLNNEDNSYLKELKMFE